MHEEAIVKFADRTTDGGAIIGVAGWLASANWIGWAGVVIALAGYLTSLHFLKQRDRREQAESEARIAALRERCDL